MFNMAKDIHKRIHSRHSKIAEHLFDRFSYFCSMDGDKIDDTHPLAYKAR